VPTAKASAPRPFGLSALINLISLCAKSLPAPYLPRIDEYSPVLTPTNSVSAFALGAFNVSRLLGAEVPMPTSPPAVIDSFGVPPISKSNLALERNAFNV
jgi:hypothetical protein